MITDTAESLKWRVVERFYLAWNNFQSVHDRYEQIVHDYVDKLGVPREKIRLDPRDLFELLSTQDLEVLRDDFLTPLKTACHRLFRTEDSTDFLDRLVNDIFHELSILKVSTTTCSLMPRMKRPCCRGPIAICIRSSR